MPHLPQIFNLLSFHVIWGSLTTLITKKAHYQSKKMSNSYQQLLASLYTMTFTAITFPLGSFHICHCWWLQNRLLAKWNAGLLLFMRKLFIKSFTCYSLGLGSWSAWFWSPALCFKCKGAEQHVNWLSGDRTMLELLPKTQAGSKSIASRWKHLLGSTVGVYLSRWPWGERLGVPLPTAGWQADLFLWALVAYTVGQR